MVIALSFSRTFHSDRSQKLNQTLCADGNIPVELNITMRNASGRPAASGLRDAQHRHRLQHCLRCSSEEVAGQLPIQPGDRAGCSSTRACVLEAPNKHIRKNHLISISCHF